MHELHFPPKLPAIYLSLQVFIDMCVHSSIALNCECYTKQLIEHGYIIKINGKSIQVTIVMIIYFIPWYVEKHREFYTSQITHSGESCMPYQEDTHAASVRLNRKETELACIDQPYKLFTRAPGRKKAMATPKLVLEEPGIGFCGRETSFSQRFQKSH